MLLASCNLDDTPDKGSIEAQIEKKYKKEPHEYDIALLEAAIAAHDVETVKFLNLVMSNFESQLIFLTYKAIEQNDTNALKLIFSCGISINYKDEKHNYSLLHYSILNNRLRVTKYLLEQKAKVNIKDELGDTPLHKAVDLFDLAMIKRLIQFHANIYAKNNQQKTPLDKAVDQTLKKKIIHWSKLYNNPNTH